MKSRFEGAAKVSAASMPKCADDFTPIPQPALFRDEQQVTPGSLNDENVIRGIVTDAIRNCSKSREVIAEEMTVLLGERVSARMLNSYTAESAEKHRWPAQYTRAFCHATGDWRLIRCVTERAGLHLITSDEADMLELGRQYLLRKSADEKIARLEKLLSGRSL